MKISSEQTFKEQLAPLTALNNVLLLLSFHDRYIGIHVIFVIITTVIIIVIIITVMYRKM